MQDGRFNFTSHLGVKASSPQLRTLLARHFSLLALLVLPSFLPSSQAIAALSHSPSNASIEPSSIVADKREISIDTGEELSRSRVQFGAGGLRAIAIGADVSAEYLENFVTDQIWLVDRHRGVFTEVPITTTSSEATITDESSIEEESSVSSLFSVTPCAGQHLKYQENMRWRGLDLAVWQCLDSTGKWVSRQWFSSLHGFVIREEHRNRRLQELVNIEFVDFPENHFQPHQGYREVDIHTFVVGSEPLLPYKNEL